MRRLARVLGSGLLVVVLLLLVTREALDAPRPVAGPGPGGDALARKMEAAVNVEAWRRTGAVTWVFAGSHRHLWDRERGLDMVTMGEDRVLVDLGRQVGRAFNGDEPVEGRRGEKLVEKAYAAWVNDSFWLNPVVKAFDEGVNRAVVVPTGEDAGKEGLLVSYASGGLTPGDAYLWLLEPDGTPSAWRMWVSVIPVGGVRASWEGWITLATGARVSTQHRMGPVTLELSEVAGAATLADLAPGPDPFAPMMQ